MKQRANPTHLAARRAFTLVELVLACALLAILLAAGRGAIFLASKSARSVPADQSVTLSAALNQVSADILGSTQIFELSQNSIGLVVPDRNGDGEDESIKYSWSGTAGAPLLRTQNSGNAEAIVASLQSFAVAAVERSITIPGQPTKNVERLVGGNSATSGLYGTSISSSNARAGSFVPANLPAGATSWSLTRVRVMVRQNSPVSGSFSVQVQRTNAQTPSGQVLASVNVAESELSSSFAWKEVKFSGLENLSTISPLAIVINRVGSAMVPCDLQITGSGGAQVAGNVHFSSSDGGTTWTSNAGNDMIYAVYGIPNTPTPSATGSGASTVRIRAESSPGVVVHINVAAPNVPQV